MARTLSLSLSGASLPGSALATDAEVVEAISAPTRATVHLLCEEEIDADATVGRPALLEVSVDGSPARHFQLVVTAVAYAGTHLRTRRHRYSVELAHELHLLSLRSDVRMFQEKNAKDIAAEVLEQGGVAPDHVAFSIARTPSTRVYCVQYRETDLDFLSRILEHEGIFYVIRDDAGSTLVTFADAQSAFDPVEGETAYRLADDHARGAGIHEFWLESRAVPEKVTAGDYNFETPTVDLTMHEEVGDPPRGDFFEYAAGFATQDEGATLARLRMEEQRVFAAVGTGQSDRMAMRAGSWFELTEASREELSTRYLLHTVTHLFVTHAEAGEQLEESSYLNRFTCVLFDRPFRPPRRAPRPRVPGLHEAVVTGPGGEIHTDRFGRMKGKFFWDRAGAEDDTSSCWIRVTQLPIGGSMTLARMTWEMAIAYVHGDPDRPVAVARLYNAEKTSPYAYPDAGTRMALQTPSSPASGKSNEIRMEDGAGGMELFINSAKDFDAKTLNDKSETVSVDDTLKVGLDAEITVGASQKVTVGGNETTRVKTDLGLGIAVDRAKEVGGSETVTVGGDIAASVKGSDAESTGGSHTTLAGMGVNKTSTGSYALSVGGSMLSAAGLGVSVAVAGAKSETIGGAYLVASGKVVTETVAGAMARTVGGVLVQNAAGSRLGTTTGASAITVGGLVNASAAGKLTMKASSVSIRVAGTANLLGGGGIINLTPGSAAFVGLVALDASGSIKLSGNPNLVG